MNPLTNMKNVKKLSEQELHRNFKTSWHDQYKDSAWIFVGGLPYDLTEGDIICVFSQYGEVVNINLVRDKGTGKQKGFCFICYEDQRSTVLAVDNLNGIKILNRTIRVDHVNDYKMPRQKEVDAETKKIYDEGCGPGVKHEKRPVMPIPSTELPAFARENEAPPDGFRLPPRLPIGTVKIEILDEEIPTNVKVKKEKKQKKDKKKKKSKKKHKKKASSSESSDSSSSSSSEEEKNTEEIKSSKQSDPKITISDEEQKSPQKSTDISDSGRKYGIAEHRSHKETKRSNQFDERDDRRYHEHSRRYEDRSNERRDRRYLDEKDERKRRPDDRRDRDESKRYKR